MLGDSTFAKQSRRDDLLLTDGFNRRMQSNARSLQSPARTILEIRAKERPFGTLAQCVSLPVRRLHLRLIKFRPCGTALRIQHLLSVG